MSSLSGGGGPYSAPHSADLSTSSRSNNPSGQQPRNEPTNQRYSNLIYDSDLFLTKLAEFKPQSLGCLEARRKSSSTLIFPNPQQACMGLPKCPRYPHDIKPTPGYWIECHGPGVFNCKNASATTAAAHSDNINVRDEYHQSTLSSHHHTPNQKSSSEREFRTTPASKLEEISIVDCGGRSSGSSAGYSQHFLPTTATAERMSTSLYKDNLGGDNSSNFIETPSPNLSEQQQQQVMKRGQSFDRLQFDQKSSEQAHINLDTSRGSYVVGPDDDQQHKLLSDYTSDNSQVVGGKRSAIMAKTSSGGNNTTIAPATTVPTTPSSFGAGSTPNKPELRKKLNKRTITRDDIDLHKPRRGTPNITITEPSFNQSTITYQTSSNNKRQQTSRQDSQTTGAFYLKRMESVETSPTATTTTNEPIKFQIQSFMSIEAQSSIDDPITDKELSTFIRRQETLESEEPSSPVGSPEQKTLPSGLLMESGALDFKPYRQQHRPSVIREDIDMEAENAEKPSASGAAHQHHSDNKELYCGLSTTTFQKKSYQQSQNTEQFKDGSLELISFEEENYEKHYYGREHWNYFTNDELLGPVMLSLKQEVNNGRDHFHVLLRTVSYTLHGTIPASTICADRYDREAVVRELSEIAKLKPPLMLGQLPSTPDELLKLDHIFIKTELKVGVIYIKDTQAESEEAILGNKEESPLFSEFLDLLGDRITLKGFDRYKGGLDTVHNLTGTESVYTMWRNIEIMFHVSTMLPHEENDPQKLQKKRHIGNDIVCVAFIESDDTLFWPGCIKSYFLHTFITIRTSPKPPKEGEKRKYSVSCVCRNEVQYAFKPYLVEQDEFFKSDYFREWLLVKIVNGERASYSAPKFARMQDRTRSQLLEDIITNLANHLVTGQIPKPYRRGSWRPLGHTRASSPLEDSMKDYFEDYEQLAKDFQNAFCGPSRSMLCDVVFRVKDKDGSYKLVHGVRAIMAIRSRTFLEMLYGFVPPGMGHSSLQNQTSLRAIEMKALSGESSSGAGKEMEQTKSLLAKRGSVGADSGRKIGEKERRQSMLPALSKSISQKPNYLTVPNTGSGAGGGGAGGGGSGTSGMIKNAFNRLVTGNWSGWSGNIKAYKGEPMHIKVDQNKAKPDLNTLAICKEIAKIDADKLSQREFEIKEFDYETFQQTIEYIHNGQCKLSYETIPGLICAAEHYDLPDLLHACFHHANTYMKLSAAPEMMNSLYQNSCFYVTAMQLLDAIYEFIDPRGNEFFSQQDYYELNESVFTTLLCRKGLQISELKKFQAMDGWARHQIANKQQAKIQLQKQKSLEQQQEKLVEIEQPTINVEENETEYRNLMHRLNKDVNIKLDKISNEDLIKVVLPTRVFSNEKIFEIMARDLD